MTLFLLNLPRLGEMPEWLTEQFAKLSTQKCVARVRIPLSPLHLTKLNTRSGRSSARLECLLWEQEAAGSNPAAPTMKRFRLVAGTVLF